MLLGLQQKQAIINQVIEGRLPLWEAASRFQAAHQAARVCLETATGVPSHSIDGEAVCRTIIGWVCLALSDRPEHADRVSERLEGELREFLDEKRRADAAQIDHNPSGHRGRAGGAKKASLANCS